MPDSPQSRTNAVCRFITSSSDAAWPESILELGRRHILDTLASIVACGDREVARLACGFATLSSGSVQEGAPILGTSLCASLPDAVFASAITAHGAEINDFCPSAFVQPGPAVVSAGLTVASVDHIPGARLLRAVIAGYELTCRIPKALGIENGRRMGYSSHGYGPVFGSATAIAVLRGYSGATVEHMLSYCAQQASGSLQWLLDFDPGYLTQDLGTRFEMPLVAYKRYPVGGPTQPVVEAMLRLVRRVQAHEVSSIEVEMPGAVQIFAQASMPALNIPYLCATILLDGELHFEMADSLDRKTHDEKVRRLMRQVRVSHDPAQESVPRKESARVTIERRDGTREVEFVEHVRGFPADPMTREDVEDKARCVMDPRLGKRRTEELIELAWHIDELADCARLANAMLPLEP